MSDCKVSVIIPVYNCEQFLRQCLDTVLRQTLFEIEVILINDASTDGSQVVINEYLERDDRIHAIELKQNRGVSVARNAGIEKATAEFVIFLDADDYWESDQMLEHLYDKATREQADFISFGFCRINEAGDKSGFNVEAPATINLRQQGGWQIKYNVWAKLLSRKLLSDYAIRFEPSLVMGEDALFSIALYCNADRLVVTDDIYYCYRINPRGANLEYWSSAKLFDSARWFAMAITLIHESVLFSHRPDVLQSIIIERLKMLCNKLGPMALELLPEHEQQDFFNLWAQCFERIDPSYFNTQFQSNPDIGLYREMLELVKQKDVTGLGVFFKSKEYQHRAGREGRPVTLTQQQAIQLGQDLLQVNRAHIRCDFGGGVIVTLPKDRAHQLAKQLIANRNPRITLNFN
jgi:glycosyltransferase involved in cell wall biosynthesis